MRKFFYAASLTLIVAALAYGFIHKRPLNPELPADPQLAKNRGGGTSEPCEPPSEVQPVPDAPDPLKDLVEPIVVERPMGATVEDEVVVFNTNLHFADPPVERMEGAPRPDAGMVPERMPYADDVMPVIVKPWQAEEIEQRGVHEEAETVEPERLDPTGADYHRLHPSCPWTGRCPVPHISYPVPSNGILR